MTQAQIDEFTPAWEQPGDAELHWQWDKLHNPRPLPPLSFEFGRMLLVDVFIGARAISVNGYTYSSGLNFPMPDMKVWQRGAFDVWSKDYAPMIEDICAGIRGTDYDSKTAVELADSLDTIFRDSMEAWRPTLSIAMAFGAPTNQLMDFAEEKLGPEAGQLVATVLQGFENKSAEAGDALGRLADEANRSSEVATAIREGRFGDIESVSGGPEFLAELRDWLDVYGWRVDQWGHLHNPTWAEDPTGALELIASYLKSPELSPAASIERSIASRERAEAEIVSGLSAEDKTEFDKLFEAAKHHVNVSEGRAFWQLTIDGSLRVPCLALGRKLVDAGVISEPNYVFYFSMGELKQLARNPSPQHDPVASRKADLARWEKLAPPPYLGSPPPPSEMAPDVQRAFARFYGGEVRQAEDANLVKGHAASKGTATGRARIIMQLSDANLLQKGEILVCPSTAPPWTPLFAIAAAVVTDTGGILSHSAICAREFGIPAVVGTQTATHRIPDGATITVDGAAGTVRIES